MLLMIKNREFIGLIRISKRFKLVSLPWFGILSKGLDRNLRYNCARCQIELKLLLFLFLQRWWVSPFRFLLTFLFLLSFIRELLDVLKCCIKLSLTLILSRLMNGSEWRWQPIWCLLMACFLLFLLFLRSSLLIPVFHYAISININQN